MFTPLSRCAALGLTLLSLHTAAAQPATSSDKRGLVAGSTVLRLSSGESIRLQSASGGDTSVNFGGAQTAGTTRREQAGPEVSPLEVEGSLSLWLGSDAARQWTTTQVGGGPPDGAGTDGSVAALNHDGQTAFELNFKQARVAGFAVSPLDGSSKEPAMLSFTLRPASSSWNASPKAGKDPSSISAKQKQSLSANFRVKIDGLPTSRIFRVEGIGATRTDAGWTPERVRLSVSAADMPAYMTWLQDALEGKADAGKGKMLTVELLDAAMKDAVATFTADNARIARATLDFGRAGTEKAAAGQVELVVDRWTLK